jgi:hypothetical protein
MPHSRSVINLPWIDAEGSLLEAPELPHRQGAVQGTVKGTETVG